jgi:site-specific recombinase XerD
MSDLIEEFCSWYHSYHNISEGRAATQMHLLRRLETFLDGRPISSLEARDLERFLADGTYAPTTVAKHIKMLRPFFKWLWQHKHINGDRLMELRGVRAPRGSNGSLPRPYTKREIAEFWEHFDDVFPWTAEKDIRNVTPKRAEFWVRRWQRGVSQWKRVQPYARRLQADAIVSLALFGGLRRIEIFNLQLEDMHQDNAYVRVTGARKNSAGEAHVRAVPMVQPLRVALGNWLEFRAQVLEPPHTSPWLCLWHERYLNPMRFDALAHMLDRVGDGYELHRLRHTFATQRLRAGMNIEKLQVAMGHANISMTLRYAKISDEDVLREAEKSNDEFVAAVQRSHV